MIVVSHGSVDRRILADEGQSQTSKSDQVQLEPREPLQIRDPHQRAKSPISIQFHTVHTVHAVKRRRETPSIYRNTTPPTRNEA